MSGMFMKKIGIGVLIMVALLGMLPGCSALNDTQANKVTSALEQRYGKEFSVAKIGDRLMKASATTYCYAADQPDMWFEATLLQDGEVTDNYSERRIERQAEDELATALLAQGIRGEAHATISSFADMTYEDESLRDFIRHNNPVFISFSIALINNSETKANSAALKAVLVELSRSWGIPITLIVTVVAEESGEECLSAVRTMTYFNETTVSEYGVVREFTLDATAEGAVEREAGTLPPWVNELLEHSKTDGEAA
jgi:hypothetical protein